jgi:ligand-binding SRPBCC domain-containing protein
MRTYRFTSQLWLPQPRARIFEFFSDPHNLDRLTPAWLRFQILSPHSTIVATGTLLDYRLRLHGLPIHWQSEIAVWDPPRRFVDRQTKGPYSVYEGGTLIGDNVDYAVPGGRLVQKLFVEPDLRRIFAYRRQTLEQIFDPARPAPASQARASEEHAL